MTVTSLFDQIEKICDDIFNVYRLKLYVVIVFHELLYNVTV